MNRDENERGKTDIVDGAPHGICHALFEPGTQEQREHAVEAEQVHRAMEKIPLAFREVLTLHFLEDLSVNQTAEVIGIPPGTVKSRLYHAKRALRAALQDLEKPWIANSKTN